MKIFDLVYSILLWSWAVDAHFILRRAVDCPKITDFNGRVKYRRGGSRALFRCPKSFNRHGPKRADCQDDGTWSDNPPVCVKDGCIPLDARKVYNLEMDVQQGLVTFKCLEHYVLIGEQWIYCDGSKWSAPMPRCAAPHEMTECDFELDLCGWTQDDNDERDWLRQSGITPTGGTGPTFDHTYMSSQRGHYMYFEVSTPTKEGDTAILKSPSYSSDLSPICFDFWYHVLGPNEPGHVGILDVYVVDESEFIDDDDVVPLFSTTGNQGNEWQRGEIQIDKQDESFQVVFVATKQASYLSDIAIDDVRLFNCTDNSTIGVTTPQQTTTTTVSSTSVSSTTISSTKSPMTSSTAAPKSTSVSMITNAPTSAKTTMTMAVSSTQKPKTIATTTATTIKTTTVAPTTAQPTATTTSATLRPTTQAPLTTPTPSSVTMTTTTTAATTKKPTTERKTNAKTTTMSPTTTTVRSDTTTQTTTIPTTRRPTTAATQRPKTSAPVTDSLSTTITTTVKQATSTPIPSSLASSKSPSSSTAKQTTAKRTSSTPPKTSSAASPTHVTQKQTPKATKRPNSVTTKTPNASNSTKDNSVAVVDHKPDDETLKPLMIGLGVGIVAGLIIIGVIAYVCVRRRKFYTSRYEDELKPITNAGSVHSLNDDQFYKYEEFESES